MDCSSTCINFTKFLVVSCLTQSNSSCITAYSLSTLARAANLVSLPKFINSIQFLYWGQKQKHSVKGIPGRVLGTFVRFQYSCFKTTRCLLFTLFFTSWQLLQQPSPAPLMTSCAEQQQTLDRAADFIYINCNPTLHKKKKNPCAKKKISYSSPLFLSDSCDAFWPTLLRFPPRPRSNIAERRPTRSMLFAALPLRRMFVFVPRQLRCSGAPRARPASDRKSVV